MTTESEATEPDLSKYVVYLAVPMQAPSAESAVRGMVNVLNERGVINWLYRVDETTESGNTLAGYFNGHGISPEDIEAPPNNA